MISALSLSNPPVSISPFYPFVFLVPKHSVRERLQAIYGNSGFVLHALTNHMMSVFWSSKIINIACYTAYYQDHGSKRLLVVS
jgi:hypothetical protein